MPKKLFNYPNGLYTIAFVEMWERFSFYGMRYCFVLYMVTELLYSQQKSSYIYGLYGSLAFFAPLLCGYIVDRYIGMRKAITIGSFCRFFGLLLLGNGKEEILVPSLALIIIATGFLRAGMNPMVGLIYDNNTDSQRDAGFRFFYTFAYIGVLFGVLVCGYVGQKYGYRYAFISAGITIMIGQIGYFLTSKNTLGDIGKMPMFKKDTTNNKLTYAEKHNLFVMFVVFFIFINIYDICYEQQGNVITLFIENNVNRYIGDFLVPTPWFHLTNSLVVIIFTPLLGLIWQIQSRDKREKSYIDKFAIGLLLVSISYVILIIAGYYIDQQQIISMSWIIVVYIIQTISEIYVFPTGNSLAVKLAPKKFISLCIGFVSLEACLANFLSGLIGVLYSHIDKMSFFAIFAILAFVAFIAIKILKQKLEPF